MFIKHKETQNGLICWGLVTENYDEMESYYDTADNEIRLLFHLTPPADNLIAFNVTTSSGQYNVSYYDKNDNLISVDVNSNTKFEANLMYDDFKHEMLDGTRQVLIVITPTTIGNNLLTFTRYKQFKNQSNQTI